MYLLEKKNLMSIAINKQGVQNEYSPTVSTAVSGGMLAVDEAEFWRIYFCHC